MGLFGKLKDFLNGGTTSEEAAQKQEEKRKKQEEERQRKEEERKKQEELRRFMPENKSLEWFSSEDGLKAYEEYITPRNYILQETINKEIKSKGEDYPLDIYASVFHKDSKIPYSYFKNLVRAIKAQPLEYVGPTETLVLALSIQAKPFVLDEDGEPQKRETILTPEMIVSIEKNPILNFVANFKCFELKDDIQGSWEDKWNLYKEVIYFLGVMSELEEDVIIKNSWVFNNETYFNDLGTVRKVKGFFKQGSAQSQPSTKAYFERKLEESE